MTRTLKAIVLGAIPLTLVLASCSLAGGTSTADDLNDFAVAYQEAADVRCSTEDVVGPGWVRTECGSGTIITVFESTKMRDEMKRRTALPANRRWLQGWNWLVSSTQGEVERAHEHLGGEILGD